MSFQPHLSLQRMVCNKMEEIWGMNCGGELWNIAPFLRSLQQATRAFVNMFFSYPALLPTCIYRVSSAVSLIFFQSQHTTVWRRDGACHRCISSKLVAQGVTAAPLTSFETTSHPASLVAPRYITWLTNPAHYLLLKYFVYLSRLMFKPSELPTR